MAKQFKLIIKIIIYLVIIILIITYNYYHKQNIKKIESYYYYKIIKALETNDNKSAKFYTKKIFNKNTKNIYYDISCFFLYKFSKNEKKKKKMIYYKNKILKNKTSIFKNTII